MLYLPPEILGRIFKLSAPSPSGRTACQHFATLSLVCIYWRDLASPLLYTNPFVTSDRKLSESLYSTLAASPEVAKVVRGLHIDIGPPPDAADFRDERYGRQDVMSLLEQCPNLELLWVNYAKLDFVDVLVAAPTLRSLTCKHSKLTCSNYSFVSLAHPLEFLEIEGGTVFRNHLPSISLPCLRHLSYRAIAYGKFDPFCHTLENVRSLNLSITALSPEMGKLLATCNRLDDLAISIRDCERTTLGQLCALDYLKDCQIRYLTLKGVRDGQSVVDLLGRRPSAFRTVESTCIYCEVPWQTGSKERFKGGILLRVHEICKERGLLFDGLFDTEDDGWLGAVMPQCGFVL